MKLNSKSRYAVMALADIANFNKSYPVSLRDISLRQNISLVYLEQIFSKLKKNSIVKSIRGTNGGYILSKDPSHIKLSSVFSAVFAQLNSFARIKDCSTRVFRFGNSSIKISIASLMLSIFSGCM